MSYIVVYQREDGSSGLEECESLDLAVVAAERLRNVDSVENPRIFKTEEVKFDFRPYYRVEVSDGEGGSDESAPSKPEPVGATSASSSTTTSTITPLAESEPSAPPAAPAAPSSSPVSSIDPWAAAESAPVEEPSAPPAPPAPTAMGSTATEAIDYSNDAIPDLTDAASAPTPEAVPVAEAEVAEVLDADSSRGLFSATSLPDPPKDDADIGALADDVSDAVPPRRGLFGR